MKYFTLLVLLLSFVFSPALAQLAKPDVLETKKGPLTIQPVTHGSLVLTWNKQTIYVDPYGGWSLYTGQPAPNLILITDIHADHLDSATLNAINTAKAKFIVPQAVADMLPDNLKAKAMVLANGATTKYQDIEIKAIPMYNLPETADSRHPKGRGNGYVLTIGGKNIYISGDTEDTPEMRALKNIDVAFVCMNLPFTMPVEQAAQGVLAFKPKIVYPYHYRGQEGLSDVKTFEQLVKKGNSKIEVRLRNWYPNQ
ncbi:MBL fold metallo-hydrolase [Adhaeribacter soli]|uniref:MBL fold metallo-hydrolase n=1 Tax=Adhaeribacter soli TaxID=2607655 RepID=A0A5N1INY1_9BACT|nr:MBL fold metallo-hydrolase [Adhaeribacter soli]KAA9331772.1 MBL fold metallo-hydrolase [Adhaeribacter soli]